MGDFFKPIVGFPGYRVSERGEVQSCWNRVGRRGGMTDNWLPLRPIPDRWCHLSVNLHRHRRKIRRFIHHLVLEAYVSERPPGAICCHWDGDPANNRSSNLRWDTYKSNCDDMLRHGNRRRGETGTSARLKEGEVREIRRLMAEGSSPDELAARFGVGSPNIKAIACGRTWRHIL
jgi:HNH endonuclease